MRPFFVLFIALIFWGCEKDISFPINTVTDKLVVDATIETGTPPVVFLSRSLGYFGSLDPTTLAASQVRNAEVWVSNDLRTHKLRAYEQPLAPGFTLVYYGLDSANLSTAFVGETGKRYNLRIRVDGAEYTASTTIPQATRRIDSLFWRPKPLDTAGRVDILVRATDPSPFGDYTRYWTKRNREPFFPGFNSVNDDLFIDGTTYEVQVDPGFNRTDPQSSDERAFRRGDTLVAKLANIDKATYDFWRTMEYSYGSIGNPFSTPTGVLGNVSGGALGYFGGYATQFRTLIIPR